MLQDTRRLTNQLPTSSANLAMKVYYDLKAARPYPEETLTALALSAGLRDVVDAGNILGLVESAFVNGCKMSLVKLLGFADARCRKEIGAWLSRHPEIVGMMCGAVGINCISHSRRINGLFRYAINYAQEI